ncbi:MAG: tetratricopeptide repeat protein [Patescibacteria group bacterium]|nr:tetratricopeptide repeat protein [Patescibacteria group bacterium]
MRKLLKNNIVLYFIIGLTFLVYYQSLFNGFVYWDDYFQITNNPDIQNLNLSNIIKIFSSQCIGMYQPITSSFYLLIHHFFGQNPFAFHLFSLSVHLVNVTLVWFLTQKFFKNNKKFLAITITALFAFHPSNVEAVAWISGLGTVLSTSFLLAALLIYYQDKKTTKTNIIFYFLAIAAYLSKSSTVILPLLLLLIDWLKYKQITLKNIYSKWPLWIASVGMGLITIWARNQEQHFSNTVEVYSVAEKIILWFYSFGFYFIKALVPYHLSPFYLYPAKINSWLPIEVWLIAALLLLIVAGFIICKKTRQLLPLAFWFFINLILIIRIIPIGNMITADRYQYLSNLAVFGIIGLGLSKLNKKISLIIIALTVSMFTVITFFTIPNWKNEITVMTTAINFYGDNPESAFLYDNRGNSLAADNKITEAVKDFQTAIYLNPKLANSYNNLGLLTVDYFKNPKQAIKLFDEAINRDFTNSRYHYNKATTLAQYSQAKLALSEFDLAIKLNKQGAPADYYHNRGNAKLTLRDFPGAIADFKTAYQANNNPLSLSMLGLAKFNAGDKSGACRNWLEAAKQKEATAIKNLSNCH